MKFVLNYKGRETVHDSFANAFRVLYREVMADDNLSTQILETFVWILEEKTNSPIFFYDARDRACNEGILIDGKLT